MKRIALFGGTFDPIHFGHLNLAIQMLEIHKLDEIIFCPANYSPHKESDQPAAENKHRKAMTALAIAPIKAFSLVDYELDLEGPSYTIHTAQKLVKTHSGAQFFLILGEDALTGLHGWKEIETLLSLTAPLIGSRSGKSESACDLSAFSERSKKAIQKGMTQISIMEISSTNIRERLHQKKYCGHLVPLTVLNYIDKHALYH